MFNFPIDHKATFQYFLKDHSKFPEWSFSGDYNKLYPQTFTKKQKTKKQKQQQKNNNNQTKKPHTFQIIINQRTQITIMNYNIFLRLN